MILFTAMVGLTDVLLIPVAVRRGVFSAVHIYISSTVFTLTVVGSNIISYCNDVCNSLTSGESLLVRS